MKKYWFLIISLIIGFSLRVYQLEAIPNGLTWDEAALGYNAYSILKTGRDEFGTFMPLIFKSFGDYKPGLYIYLTVPSVAIFGLNEFSVRFPSVVFGTLAILGLYLFVRELFKKEKYAHLLGLLSALALAISPWHVHFSRGAWETNVYSNLLLFGLYYWLRFIRGASSILPSLVFACASLLTYQSAKLLTPLNFIILTLFFLPDFLKILPQAISKKKNLIPLVIASVFGIWFFISTFFGPAGNRLARLSIFGYKPDISQETKIIDGNNPLIYNLFHNQTRLTLSLIASRYLYHFSPEVLFYESSAISQRGHLPGVGMLQPLEFVWLLLGLIFIARNWKKKEIVFVVVLLLLSPLPGSMTLEEFSTVRTHFLTIPLAIVSAMGMLYLLQKNKYILLGLTLPYLITHLYTFDLYFLHSQKFLAPEYNYGYKQAMEVVNRYPNSRVLMTDVLGQPYIYYLFYSRYDPARYQKNNQFIEGGIDVGKVNSIDKIEFRQFSVQDILTYKDTVFIGTEGNIPNDFDTKNPVVEEHQIIDYPGGQNLFRIIKTKK